MVTWTVDFLVRVNNFL